MCGLYIIIIYYIGRGDVFFQRPWVDHALQCRVVSPKAACTCILYINIFMYMYTLYVCIRIVYTYIYMHNIMYLYRYKCIILGCNGYAM